MVTTREQLLLELTVERFGPAPRPSRRRTAPEPGVVVWSRYAPAGYRLRCDDCSADLMGVGGAAVTPRQARWRRAVAGGADRLLCYEHAQLWRAADRLAPLRQPRPTRAGAR